ncbi:type I restriction enzyme HsdR N-terminal domain-containing protein [Pedobacter sp. SYP-B3415]|uniref:type I restriction enzyme HsdR N-terminal domain-containing protein n=1 Tax=Pedobacter sp. SYP-B3415 TaxID=2496641 RepID=UPI00101D2EB3|nr:type I restriction enzyme HsdR N-terminal domain-containing protein [Pedobacter sp. SYP-B3415]
MSFEPVPLNLPPYPFRLTEKDGNTYIFDEIRKKHLFLTPEEWVRQHFIQFLASAHAFPKTLIRIEGGLQLHQMQKRSDLLVYDRQGNKVVLVECKAPGVRIDQKVFDQAARYNLVHKARWLAVTNGLNHYYARIDHDAGLFQFFEKLPVYEEL